MDIKVRLDDDAKALWEDTLTIAKEAGILWRESLDRLKGQKSAPEGLQDPRLWPPARPGARPRGLRKFLQAAESWRSYQMSGDEDIEVIMRPEFYAKFVQWCALTDEAPGR